MAFKNLSSVSRGSWAIASLFAARIVYAINWLNIGALFYLMAGDLNVGVAGLGTLTSSFYLGIGLMQIPGGVLAAVWGPRKTVITGIMVSSTAVLGTSISPDLVEVAVLRFIVGAGMALVFAPAVILATKFLGGKSGFGVGLINSGFSLGGLFGLFAWILIATVTGWRPSLMLSGALGVLTGLLVILIVPRDLENSGFRISGRSLAGILKNRNLALLGLGCLSVSMGSVLIPGFMVFYLESELQEPAWLAGLVTAMVVVLPIATSVWGGRVYDRAKKPRRLMIVSGLGMVGALAACSVPTISIAAVGAVLAGVVAGPAYTTAFAAAKDLSGVPQEYESLTIGWVNSISLTGSVWPPLVFSYLASSLGYFAAWLGVAGLSLVFITPTFLLVDQNLG